MHQQAMLILSIRSIYMSLYFIWLDGWPLAGVDIFFDVEAILMSCKLGTSGVMLGSELKKLETHMVSNCLIHTLNSYFSTGCYGGGASLGHLAYNLQTVLW